MPATNEEVLIIGDGPAGLAAAGCLRRRGVAARIRERGSDVARSWARYYDRVRHHTGKHRSTLPNAPPGRGYPRCLGRGALVRYFRDYARRLAHGGWIGATQCREAGGRARTARSRQDWLRLPTAHPSAGDDGDAIRAKDLTGYKAQKASTSYWVCWKTRTSAILPARK